MRIDSVGAIPIKPEIAELIKNLNIGDTVKGRIVETSEGAVLLKTAGGQLLAAVVATAFSKTDIQLQKGQFVELLINNISGDKIIASLKESSPKEPDVDVKLSELLGKMNMPVNDKNIEAAKLLVKYDFPVNKENLTGLIQLQKSAASLSQTKGEGAIGLMLSELDIHNTPVEVLNKITLISEPDVKALLSKLVQMSANENDTAPLGKVAASHNVIPADEVKPLVDTAAFVDAPNAGKAAVNKETQPLTPNPQGNIQEAIPDEKADVKTQIPTAVLDEAQNQTAAKKIPVDEKSLSNEKLSPNEKLLSDEKPFSTEKPLAAEKPSSAEKPLSNDVIQMLKKINIDITPEIKQLIDNISKAVDVAGKTNMESIMFLQSTEMEITPKHLAALDRNINNENKVSEFLGKLQQQIDKTLNVNMDKEGIAQLRQIKEEIGKIFVHPKQVEDKEAVKEQFRELVKLGDKLGEFLSKNNMNDSDIKSTLSNLKDNIDFLKNVNQYNNYLQIPVMLNNNPTTADVYVFKDNKKGKTINPQNATILIALDLKNLGHLESMINVVQKQVNVTFRVQDKKIGDMIESGSKELSTALEAKGYRLNPVKIIKLEQPFNLISLQELMQEGNMGKMHFDMRV